jgi:hypothetical protein
VKSYVDIEGFVAKYDRVMIFFKIESAMINEYKAIVYSDIPTNNMAVEISVYDWLKAHLVHCGISMGTYFSFYHIFNYYFTNFNTYRFL